VVPPPAPETKPRGLPNWFKGAAPLVLLAVLVAMFLKLGPLGVLRQGFPPVEELTIERITLPEPGEMRVRVVNGGPEPVTVAQVTVDDAAWSHALDGPRTIGRLETRNITLPYPWVEGEPHVVKLVTSTGLTFEADIAVATQTPRADATYLTTFALLEALETSARVAGAYQGLSLVLIGVVGTPLALGALGEWRRRRRATSSALYVAFLIATAIGLHNLGEGLAIGAAYSTGEIALGTFLVLGFLLHNTTEGLAIVAPIATERPALKNLVLFGALAGVPTILGTWMGGFSYSPVSTTLCFAIGAGAIVQVVWELWKLFARRSEAGLTMPLNALGVLAGLALMYVTGLIVTA
jgi:zinc transporter ZupT